MIILVVNLISKYFVMRSHLFSSVLSAIHLVRSITLRKAFQKNLIATFLMVSSVEVFGQTSIQNFGTTAASQTSQTGSTGIIPNPTSGTTWTRAGITVPNAPIVIGTGTNPLGSTGAYVRGVASSSTSVAKFSPWVGYTGGTEFYTSFKVMFGDSAGGSTATSGVWKFYQGAGPMYSDANDFAGAQVFTGLSFTYGAGGALALTYRGGGSSNITTGLTQTIFSSGTVYTIEIVGNNKNSGTISYTYAGVAQTVAVQKFDLYVNGTLIGDDLAEAQLPANTAIASGTFIGISSTSNVANIFVDDAITYNAVPAFIGTPTYIVTYNGNAQTSGTAPTDSSSPYAAAATVTVLGNSGTLTKTGFTFSDWNTQADGLGTDRAAASTFTMPAVNTVLFAKWVASSTPYIAPSGTLTAINTTYGTASANTGFTVSAGNLTGNLIITPPTGYEVSTSAGSGFTTSLNLGSGTQTSTSIYVRIPATTAAGTYAGTIDLTSGSTNALKATASSVVSKKSLTIIGLSATNKEYDRTTSVTVTGTPAYFGLENSESFSVSGTVTYAFTTASVGTAKGITATGTYLPPSANYTVTQPTLTAGITKKALTVTGAIAQNKPYDGTNAATITGATLGGVISGDNVTISGGGTFATANVGTGISVISNLVSGGTDGGNYSITQPTGLAANITAIAPTISTSTINLNIGGTYALQGANVSSNSTGALSYSITSGGTSTLSGTTITGVSAGTETLTVNQAADGNYTAGSKTVDIVVSSVTYVNGDYRTNPLFVGNIFFNSTAPSGGSFPWQRWNGSIWVDVVHSTGSPNSPQNLSYTKPTIYLNSASVDLAAGGTYNDIIVEGGYVYSGNTTTGLTIDTNKTFDIKAGYVLIDGKLVMNAGSNIYVRTDSEFELGSSSFNFTRNATSNLIVENDGYLYIDNYLANVWTGNENFAGESYIVVYGWDRTKQFFDAATDITNNSAGAKFGFLDIDLGTSGITGNWTYVFPSDNFKLTNKDFYLTNSTSNNVNLNPGTMDIGGDFIIYGTGNVHGRGQVGSKIFNVKGNFEKNGTGEFRLNTGTDIANPVELNVDGNFKVNAGKFVIDNGATTNLTSKVNLKGNLYKSTNTYMTNSNTNSALVTFNFTGTTPQTVDLNVGATNDMLRYNFYIKNGAYVKPLAQDWKLATDSKIIVESGGTLDFSFNGLTPLNVITNGLQVGMTFNAQSGSKLKITSPNGITKSAAGANSGNVQTPVSGRTFDKGATYHYIGQVNQATGNGIPDQIIGKLIVELNTQNTTQDDLQFTSTGTTTFGTVSGNNGILEIRKGKVIDQPNFGFRNYMGTVDPNEDGELDVQRGDIIMSGGRYVVSGAGTKPALSGIYNLAGGVVEFAGSAGTKIRTSSPPKQYIDVDISGTQVETGGKNLVVNNLLKIISPVAVLTVPQETDAANPYVVTAKKGIQVILGGRAIFKNNANLMQDAVAINNGNILAERIAKLTFISLTTRADYNYWSSPVIDQKLLFNSGTPGDSFSPGTPNNRIFEYKEATDYFVGTNDANFKGGKGYAIRAENEANGTTYTADGNPKIFTFTGTPNNGDVITANLTWKDETHGYNLIGNPYPSIINFNDFWTENKSKIYSTAYFWTNNQYTENQQGSGYTGSNYAIYNGTGGNPAPYQQVSGSPVVPTQYIKPGQGFLIQMKEAGTLKFTNDMRKLGVSPFFNNREGIQKDRFWITMTSPTNMNNVILIGYVDGATNDYEKDFDAELMVESSDQFYSKLESRKLGIQGKQYPLLDSDIIPLGAVYFETGLCTIALSEKEGIFADVQEIYLKDKLLNNVVNLSQGSYSFQAIKGVEENRFEIVYKPGGILVTTNPPKGQLQIYRSGDYFVVKSGDYKIDEIEVYDVSGRLIQKVKGGSKEVKINAIPLANGLYILKINRNNEVISKKILK